MTHIARQPKNWKENSKLESALLGLLKMGLGRIIWNEAQNWRRPPSTNPKPEMGRRIVGFSFASKFHMIVVFRQKLSIEYREDLILCLTYPSPNYFSSECYLHHGAPTVKQQSQWVPYFIQSSIHNCTAIISERRATPKWVYSFEKCQKSNRTQTKS